MNVMISDSVWKWIHRLGGPGLILLGLADNTPFISAPAGSVNVFVILLSAHRHEWWAYYALMATVGEVSPECRNYPCRRSSVARTPRARCAKFL
jgi:hypothetical protein